MTRTHDRMNKELKRAGMPFKVILSSGHTLTFRHLDTKDTFQVPLDVLASSPSILEALQEAWESWETTT